MFKKVLVANRGEIAVRVILRALRGARHGDGGRLLRGGPHALHVRYANEAYPIGPAPSRESYLRIDKIIDVARSSGADAIHPGYGFLSERAEFRRRR
jgi:acetyl/propionyl-CoA carboxylase alpha subunit